MKLWFVATLFLVVSLDLSAQIKKCIGPDGKITYSDVVCATGTKQGFDLNIRENSVDGSSDRARVAAARQQGRVDAAIENEAGLCKFPYYAIGDGLGQKFAAAAKKECLDNIAARVKGLPVSDANYVRWKDHREMTKRTVCSGTSLAIGSRLATVDMVCR